MAALTGKGIPQTGTTIFRPPILPVAIGAFAGHHRGKEFRADPPDADPRLGGAAGRGLRGNRAMAAGTVLPAAGRDATGWKPSTARCAPCARASASAMSRRWARSTCRDLTPARFLDRVYINTLSTLGVGKARYGVMLREDGMVMDDGTTSGSAPTTLS